MILLQTQVQFLCLNSQSPSLFLKIMAFICLSNPFYIFDMCIYNSIYIILGVLIGTHVIILYV